MAAKRKRRQRAVVERPEPRARCPYCGLSVCVFEVAGVVIGYECEEDGAMSDLRQCRIVKRASGEKMAVVRRMQAILEDARILKTGYLVIREDELESMPLMAPDERAAHEARRRRLLDELRAAQ